MTDEEKQAIERCKTFKPDIYIEHPEMFGSRWKVEQDIKSIETIKVVLDLIEKQQNRIKELEMTLARYTAQTLNANIKQTHKHNEDLEMLYKGCQIELEMKDKIIDEMAKYIDLLDIDEDICKNVKDKNCDDENLGRCIDCIKKYFKKKVEDK